MITKLALAATLAVAVSAPALAQQADWSQPGDYYAPGSTIVQQPTAAQLSQLQQGDYYAPSKTAVQHPSVQELNEFRQGDFYAPTAR
jgi:hypothetical protein